MVTSNGDEECGQAFVHMKWGERIPMRDGVLLHGTLYLPNNSGARTPAIFVLTPYVTQTLHEFGVYFATQGFPFLVVDTRGRGNSGGTFAPDGSEGKDGYDTAGWLARQEYCDGKVAMWGGSYAGYLQWSTAKEAPLQLVTIVPVASPFRGVDSPAPNNIFLPYRVQWLNLLAGRTSQERIFADQSFWNRQFRRWFESGRPFREIDSMLGASSEIFHEWLSHPSRDEYWDRFNPTPADYAGISIPVLTITGQYDVNQLGALTHYRSHLQNHSGAADAHFLVIGPWDHAGTRVPKAEFGGIKIAAAGLVDLKKLHKEWYEWVMRGGARPAFLKKNVAYYVMGAETWRYADSLDEVTREVRPLYLHSSTNPTDVLRSGQLVDAVPRTGAADQYLYDPRDLSNAELESRLDPASLVEQSLIYASIGKQLIYHGQPLAGQTEICGFFKLVLWIAIDQRDTDVRVSIYEIAVDGSSVLLASDSMRARYRESLSRANLVNTREPLRYEFRNFTFVARRMGQGSRLRLVVGPINSIFSEKNYNSGGVVADESMADSRPVTVRILHDPDHPSALFVPYGVVKDGH